MSVVVSTGVPASSTPLPPGWVELTDDVTHQHYYYHEATQMTTWTRPTANGGGAGGPIFKPQQPVNYTLNTVKNLVASLIVLALVVGVGAAVYVFVVAPKTSTSAATQAQQFNGSFNDSGTGYKIRFFNADNVPTAMKTALIVARTRIQSVIVDNDNTPVNMGNTGRMLCGHPERVYSPTTVPLEDLDIWVDVSPIDGVGSILGQAGPCEYAIISPSGLTLPKTKIIPVVGEMVFDSADVDNLANLNRLNDVITHEMFHILGIGTLWGYAGDGDDINFNVLTNVSTGSSYLGANGNAGHVAVLGSGSSARVEDLHGPGTAFSHWKETVYNNELMTGFLSAGSNPLSKLTVGALQDLGYNVNMTNAEPYTLRGDTAEEIPWNKIRYVNDVKIRSFKEFIPVEKQSPEQESGDQNSADGFGE